MLMPSVQQKSLGIQFEFQGLIINKLQRQKIRFLSFSSGLLTEVSHMVQVRAEGPKAPSPGHRPGYNGNQQGAL